MPSPSDWPLEIIRYQESSRYEIKDLKRIAKIGTHTRRTVLVVVGIGAAMLVGQRRSRPQKTSIDKGEIWLRGRESTIEHIHASRQNPAAGHRFRYEAPE